MSSLLYGAKHMKKNQADYEHIRKQIVRLRIAKQMTQEEFAEFVELSPRTISFIETGRKNAGLDSLLNITRAFGIMLDALASKNHLVGSTKDGIKFLHLIADCDDRERQILYETILYLKASLRNTPRFPSSNAF